MSGDGHGTAVPIPQYPADEGARAHVLREGELVVQGRMPWSSNGTFLVHACLPEVGEVLGVYKPEAGERPLWDFPAGLWRREVAAYEVALALGWALVPPTVRRDDGPLGVGSVQLFVPSDPDEHYFSLFDEPANHPALRRLAAFDVVVNSTDRKGGHIVRDTDGRIWAIDNGLSFHAEFKLRTVIWEFAGDHLDAEVVESLESLLALLETGVPGLADLLDDDELAAMAARTRALATNRRLPIDPTGRRYPWPLV
jgi:uncharacterized repeat protein (TIGR03843 family)